MRHQKKALLVVSFGTTFENAVHAIEKIEDEFKETSSPRLYANF